MNVNKREYNSSVTDLLRRIEKGINCQIEKKIFLPLTVPFEEINKAFIKLKNINSLEQNNGESVKLTINQLDLTSPIYGTRERLLFESIFNWAQKSNFFIKYCIIHGSLASGDFTSYADVDTLLIIYDWVFINRKIFNRARQSVSYITKQIITYDSLQHHGFHIIPESVLEFYPLSYLPLSALEDAKVVGVSGNATLKIRPVNSSESRIGQFKRMTDFIFKKINRPDTVYEAKLFLSSFMIIPTLALQAEGTEISKKKSFEIFAKRFSTKEWEPMEWATKIRVVWPKIELSNIEKTALSVLNPWLVSRIFIMRHPLFESLANEWTQKRHNSLLEFVKLAKEKTYIKYSQNEI
jgi:hypothetical protein